MTDLDPSFESKPSAERLSDPLALDDPEGTLRCALSAELDPLVAPEDVLLAWLLRLPDRLDPARAAARVIAGSARPVQNQRLLDLLSEVAAWPPARLLPLRCARRVRAQ